MKKLLAFIASIFLGASVAYAQVAPAATATPTSTPTSSAAWGGDAVPAVAAAYNGASYQGALVIGNPYKMPIPLNVGNPGQLLVVGTNLLPQWSSSPSLAGVRLSFSGYFPGIANATGTIVAAGSTIADSIAVVDVQEVVTGADGTKGVHLPALADVTTGQSVTVVNGDVTSALKVYSNATGETISGQAGNTAISVAAKLWLTCFKQSASAWHCTKSVTAY